MTSVLNPVYKNLDMLFKTRDSVLRQILLDIGQTLTYKTKFLGNFNNFLFEVSSEFLRSQHKLSSGF